MKRAAFPAVILDDAALMAETPYIRAVLRRSGVDEADLDDVAQEVLIGASRSMHAGRFRTNPAVELRPVLRAWLRGICWRQVPHYRARSHRRHEIPSGAPWNVPIEGGATPEEEAAARDVLWALLRLPARLREVLAMVAVSATAEEIAASQGIPVGTAASRIREARQRLRALLPRGR